MTSRAILAASLVLFALGCGSQPTEQKVELEPAELQLQQIGQAYTQAVQKLKRGPRDLAEFKPFLTAINGGDATAEAIASRKIVVIWDLGNADLALKSSPGSPPQPPVVAYFTSKDDGIRFVLTMTSRIEQMTDEQFQKAYFPKGHKPQM